MRKKYADKRKENTESINVYLPKRVKEEVDKYCEEKEIAKTTWIRETIIREMEKILEKKYHRTDKDFV